MAHCHATNDYILRQTCEKYIEAFQLLHPFVKELTIRKST